MSNEIKGIGDTARKLAELSGHAGAERAGNASKPTETAPAAPKTDTVSISDSRNRVDAARESLEAEPVVDVQRVEKVRQKIADGSFKIDDQRVAQKFMEVESMLASATGSAGEPKGGA